MNNPYPLISVVVPVFNEEKEIRELLDSFLDLDWPSEKLEILCVDNGSSDNSLQILKEYPFTVLQEPNPGPYAARNQAILHASGDFIAFTDADCKVSANWLKELWAGFDDPTVGAVGGTIVPRTVTNHIDYFEGCLFKSPNHSRGTARTQPFVVTANVMFRRAVFDELGLFDQKNFSGPDVEMSWRLIQSGRYTVRILDSPLAMVYHRYRTRFADFAYVLQRDAYGWYFLARNNPKMAPVPDARKYFVKVLIGLAVYPWTTLVRLVSVPLRKAPSWEMSQDLLRLAVLWYHFVGTWSATRAEAGQQPSRVLR
jgi:glycosyltransferase involved in cell wall biosynthesis